MQHQSWKIDLNHTISVPGISHNRMSNRIEMNPKLMAPARAGKRLHKRCRRPALLNVKVRLRRLPALIHPHPPRSKLPERLPYRPPGARKNTMDDGQVRLAHIATAEAVVQIPVCPRISGKHQNPAYLLVQTVNDKEFLAPLTLKELQY